MVEQRRGHGQNSPGRLFAPALLQATPAALPARQANGSGGARRRRFPQALGASPPALAAAAAWPAAVARAGSWCQAALRGKQVAGLPPAAYGGHKDVNEAWQAGTLAVSAWPAAAAEGSKRMARPEELREFWAERAAIMECDGGLVRPVAERAAWRCLTDTSDAGAGI